MIRSVLFASLAFLPATLTAQASTTIPLGYDKTEGEMWINAPLVYVPARIQCGYDAVATGWTAPKTITELRTRPDGSARLTASFIVEMEVILSSKGCDVRTGSLRFVENHGTDKTVFIKKKGYAFPTFGGTSQKPFGWMLSLKGDKPFVAAAGTLLVDWATYTDAKNTTMLTQSLTVDSSVEKGYFTGTLGTKFGYGRYCGINYFQLDASGFNSTDSGFRTFGHTHAAGNFVLCWLGSKKLSLPIPGRAGCYLYTDFGVFHPSVVMTNPTGVATFEWGKVPAAMVGKRVYSQMAGMKPSGMIGFSPAKDIYFGDRKFVQQRTISYLMMHGLIGRSTFDPRSDLGRYGDIGYALIFDVQ